MNLATNIRKNLFTHFCHSPLIRDFNILAKICMCDICLEINERITRIY